MAKQKIPPIDGLSLKDKDKIVRAIRQVWAWSTPRRLCLKRAAIENDMFVCEQCRATVGKVYPDHIEPVGELGEGYVARMFCPSSKLQALCKKCHGVKTRQERKERDARRKATNEP